MPTIAINEKGIGDVLRELDVAGTGALLHEAMAALYPICRSITGGGLRQSLQQLQKFVPLKLHEVATGTQVFDWVVPKEWNIRDAWIKNMKGERVLDFAKSNLHVVNYSVPVQQRLSLAELRKHLFTLPETPDWVPYRTSYYRETWGFCLSQHHYDSLTDSEYEVCIDLTLEPGNLSYGEFRIQGMTNSEVLISCHSCHPSLCNDNLSGMVVAARLAQLLKDVPLRCSYRFVWIPGTIGSITWLAQNEKVLSKIKHGLVLSCVGDTGHFHYKRSRRGSADVDRIVEHVLKHSGHDFNVLDFIPYGYDERQYCSPGINLPVGCFTRTPNGRYPEYHTSADNIDFVKPKALGESLKQLLRVVQVMEENNRFINLSPKCEPQLGRRGLYRQLGGNKDAGLQELAMLWVLNLSDGKHDLLDIAKRASVPFDEMSKAADALWRAGLLALTKN